MNKSICLLVAVLLLASQVSCADESSFGLEVSKQFGEGLGNYINNSFYFTMRTVYDLFCFSVALTYVFWFNDGGVNFYKCYNSVPANIQWLGK